MLLRECATLLDSSFELKFCELLHFSGETGPIHHWSTPCMARFLPVGGTIYNCSFLWHTTCGFRFSQSTFYIVRVILDKIAENTKAIPGLPGPICPWFSIYALWCADSEETASRHSGKNWNFAWTVTGITEKRMTKFWVFWKVSLVEG